MSTPAFDAELMFRDESDGALTGTEVNVLKFRQTPVSGQAVRVTLRPGAGGSIDVQLGAGPVGGPYTTLLVQKNAVAVPAEGADLILPFATTEFEAELTLVCGADNFGLAEAGIVNIAHDEFERDVDWS